MIQKKSEIMDNDDRKYKMKCKLKTYLLNVINEYENMKNETKIKSGRSLSVNTSQVNLYH